MNYKGYTIKIEQDDIDPLSPIDDFDMLGTMVFWHRRMNLGHCWKETNKLDPNEWLIKALQEADYAPDEWLDNASMDVLLARFESYNVVVPVYAYEHGGITIRAGSKHPYWDNWDSGQLGFIYVSHDKIKAEYGNLSEDSIQRATNCLRAEIETYDDYLNNNVWGYVVEDEDGEYIDSCWGFYGDEGKKEAESEAKSAVDYHIEDEYNSRPHDSAELAGE